MLHLPSSLLGYSHIISLMYLLPLSHEVRIRILNHTLLKLIQPASTYLQPWGTLQSLDKYSSGGIRDRLKAKHCKSYCSSGCWKYSSTFSEIPHSKCLSFGCMHRHGTRPGGWGVGGKTWWWVRLIMGDERKLFIFQTVHKQHSRTHLPALWTCSGHSVRDPPQAQFTPTLVQKEVSGGEEPEKWDGKHLLNFMLWGPGDCNQKSFTGRRQLICPPCLICL